MTLLDSLRSLGLSLYLTFYSFGWVVIRFVFPVVGILLAVILVLLLIALVRTLVAGKKVSAYTPAPDPEEEKLCAEKLSRLIQCDTVSVRDQPDPDKFRRFHGLLAELYPTVFATCEKIDIDGNLLLKWKGKTDKDPIMLMSHQDVVPAGPGWSHDPFGGDIQDGKVWGRGAADTKCSVMAFYQAAEELMAEGYVPPVDVYLSSSCTEEVGGDGAPKIAAWLQERGIRLAMLCDEGGGIISEPIKGIPGNFAMVGVYEKGFGDLKFIARGAGGHSSMPPKNTPLTRLGRFVAQVEEKNPMTVKFSPEVDAMFSRLAPYAGFGLRYVLGNLWLFKPVMKKILPTLSPQAAAMLQTTIAFTRAQGSDGYNVIPQEAWVTANLRFIPHQKSQDSIAVMTKLAAKYDLETQVLAASDPSPSLDLRGRAFRLTEAAIAQTFPGLPVSPYVVTGGTDCRFYTQVCDSCVRFSPVIFGPEQMKGMHGIDETIGTACLPGAVEYYKRIIQMQGEG